MPTNQEQLTNLKELVVQIRTISQNLIQTVADKDQKISNLTATINELWENNQQKDRIIKKQQEDYQKLAEVAKEALKELQKPTKKKKK